MNQKGLGLVAAGILVVGLALIAYSVISIAGSTAREETDINSDLNNESNEVNGQSTDSLNNCSSLEAECGILCMEDETCIDCGSCNAGEECVDNVCVEPESLTGETDTGVTDNPNACFTVDGQEGVNGEKFAEQILWKWDFESIDLNTCSQYYCDATQFSLSLSDRLEKINKLAVAGNSFDELTEFEAFLAADNYSEDFRKDFSFYYLGHFFDTPSWFNKWTAYFEDFEALTFTPANLRTSGTGKYKVKLNIEFTEEQRFFSEEKPTATIEIEFERNRGEANSFNKLALNGQVGTKRKDEDNEVKRADYGIGFTGPDYQKFEEGVISQVKAQKNMYTVELKDFGETNSKSGLIAFYAEENKTIVFAPNQATAILAYPEPGHKIGVFYRIYENSAFVGKGKPHLGYWTDLSNDLNILHGLTSNKIDCCDEVKKDQREAFGLCFNNVTETEPVLLSYFFTPIKKEVLFEKSCNNRTIFRTANEELSILRQTISLSLSQDKISEFYELPELMKQGKICVQESKDGTRFYWNSKHLAKQLERINPLNEQPIVSTNGFDHSGGSEENIIIQANSSPDTGAIGTFFSVRAYLFPDAEVLNVKLRVFKEDTLVETIKMKDDGRHFDAQKNDTVYGAIIKAKESRGYSDGEYRMEIVATDKSGKEYPSLEMDFTIKSGTGKCETIHLFEPDTNKPKDRLKITFFGEGFDSKEQLKESATEIKDFLLSVEPFKSNKEKIMMQSVYSEKSAGCKPAYSFLSKRYTVSCDWARVEREDKCESDRIIIIYNTDNANGGTTNKIWSTTAMAAGNKLNQENLNLTIAHELGHTLGLIDEYVYPKHKNSGNPSNINSWCFWSRVCKKPPFMSDLETGWNCSGDSTCPQWNSLESAECVQGCHKGGWYRPADKSIMGALKEPVFSPAAEKILEAAINYFAEGGK